MDPDRLAELEEERRFLLRSLDDLEREGDVTQLNYRLRPVDGEWKLVAMEILEEERL